MEQNAFKIRVDEKADQVYCLDPAGLPARENELSFSAIEELCGAMQDQTVRGAIAVSQFASFALCVLVKRRMAPDYPSFLASFKEYCTTLLQASPIPYSALKRAILNQVLAVQNANPRTVNVSLDKMLSVAREAQKTLEIQNRALADNALALLHANDAILIHANSSSLAGDTADPALAPILLGTERHYHFHAFVPEARPFLTGAKLTCLALRKAGVKHTLVADSGAANVLRSQEISCVLLSCDALSLNGDALCEPGALQLALCAKQCGVPVYLLCPSMLIDEQATGGALFSAPKLLPNLLIEQGFAEPIAPAGTDVLAASAEVVPHELPDAIITDKSTLYPPFDLSAS